MKVVRMETKITLHAKNWQTRVKSWKEEENMRSAPARVEKLYELKKKIWMRNAAGICVRSNKIHMKYKAESARISGHNAQSLLLSSTDF
jgi:hypothetical protein